MLIVFRVLQGAGGGGLQPSEQAILADTFPPAKRGMAFAVYGVAVVMAPAIGPTLGGWITDNYSLALDFLRQYSGGDFVSDPDLAPDSGPAYFHTPQELTETQNRLHWPGFGRAWLWRFADCAR